MTVVEQVRGRSRALLVPLLIGAAGVVAGGLVSAVTAPAASEDASWAAAYLVLVVGVAQVALVGGAAWLGGARPSARLLAGEFGAWNLGNAGVLVGTLTDTQAAVDVGGALIVAALVLALVAVRPPRRTGWLTAYRVLVAVVLVSVPVGLVLARVRG